eukprot:7110215-Lingulodinium_polyedra.AAC.1
MCSSGLVCASEASSAFSRFSSESAQGSCAQEIWSVPPRLQGSSAFHVSAQNLCRDHVLQRFGP